jgi:hypothetical protein
MVFVFVQTDPYVDLIVHLKPIWYPNLNRWGSHSDLCYSDGSIPPEFDEIGASWNKTGGQQRFHQPHWFGWFFISCTYEVHITTHVSCFISSPLNHIGYIFVFFLFLIWKLMSFNSLQIMKQSLITKYNFCLLAQHLPDLRYTLDNFRNLGVCDDCWKGIFKTFPTVYTRPQSS